MSGAVQAPGAGDAPMQEWRFGATPANVGAMRDRARTYAEAHGADPDTVHVVMLAVTEAATNAVLHAFIGRPVGTISLVCEAGQGELLVEVTDDGRGMQPRADSPGLGMGLPTMGRVATRMDVRAGPTGGGTSVRLVFRAPGVHGPSIVPRDDAEGRLLMAASDVARSAAWPQEGFERLCGLVLGAFADAACVDVVEHGRLRRLAAEVAGDPALSDRLRRSPPPLRPGTATWAALNGGGPQLVVHDPATPRPPAGIGELLELGWWLSVPLADADGAVLALWGLGGRGERPAPEPAVQAVMAEAAKRAAGGLANANVLEGMQATRRRLESVLSALGEAVSVTDPSGRFAYANEAAARVFGAADAAELMTAPSETWLARFHVTDEHGQPFRPEQMPSRRLHRGEEATPVVTRSVERATGATRWLRTTSRLLEDPDGPLVVNIVEDVSEAVRGEHRRRATLEVGELLDRGSATPAVLQEVAECLSPVLADGCAIDLLDEAGDLRRVALAHPSPEQRARLQTLDEGWPTAADPPTLSVLEASEPRVIANITDQVLQVRAYDPEHLELLRSIGFRSMVVVPLRAAGAPVGLLTLAHDELSGRTFGAADVEVAADLGRRIGTAVALARKA